jgi:hypothetical protein
VPKYLNASQNTGGRWELLEGIKGILRLSEWSSGMKLCCFSTIHKSRKLTHPPRLKKARMSKSKIKIMFIAFFSVKGITIVEYADPVKS